MKFSLVAGSAVILLLASVVLGAPTPAAEAGVECQNSPMTQWETGDGGNGHHYRALCTFDGTEWDDAADGARALGGHLVTLSSEEENDFVGELVSSRGYWDVDFAAQWCAGPLIGAFEPEGTVEPDGGWEWVTGETFDFENWAPGEPNNHEGADENRAAYGVGGCMGVFEASNEWHDVGEEDEHRAYVVEWDAAPSECVDTEVTQWTEGEGGNGHYYQGICVGARITWEDAEATAEGRGGHLATSTSAGENEFIFELIDADQFWEITTYNCIVGPWLGGRQPDGSAEPDGGWEWVTGEPFDYTNWSEGEPDDFDEDDSLALWAGCPGARSDEWVDLTGGGLGEVQSYVIEWASEPPPAPRQGDVNCDGNVDEEDAMLLLEFAADLDDGVQADPCRDVGGPDGLTAFAWGDVNCDSAVDALDALFVLSFRAGFFLEPADSDCVPIGEGIA